MASKAGRRLSARIAALAASMRAARVRVGLGEVLTAHRALAAVDPTDRAQAHDALRAALCSSREDYPIFDEAFAAAFAAPEAEPDAEFETLTPEPVAFEDPDGSRQEAAEGEPQPLAPAGWSELERLRYADFSELDADELERAATLMAALARRGPMRRSRRLRRRTGGGRGRAATVDVRRTIRDSMRYGGEPVHRRWREPSLRPRRLVVVCDTSGSMRPYAQGLLIYVQALVAARRVSRRSSSARA